MFNCEISIALTLESCTSQSYKNIEIICVDDCSTDNTVSVVDKLSCVILEFVLLVIVIILALVNRGILVSRTLRASWSCLSIVMISFVMVL